MKNFSYFCVGTIDFNLSAMPLPANEADKCTLDQISDGVSEVETDDLFKRKRMKGWWPVYEVDKEGTRLLNVRTVVSCYMLFVLLVSSYIALTPDPYTLHVGIYSSKY